MCQRYNIQRLPSIVHGGTTGTTVETLHCRRKITLLIEEEKLYNRMTEVKREWTDGTILREIAVCSLTDMPPRLETLQNHYSFY